jgi:hypothetical protein
VWDGRWGGEKDVERGERSVRYHASLIRVVDRKHLLRKKLSRTAFDTNLPLSRDAWVEGFASQDLCDHWRETSEWS